MLAGLRLSKRAFRPYWRIHVTARSSWSSESERKPSYKASSSSDEDEDEDDREDDRDRRPPRPRGGDRRRGGDRVLPRERERDRDRRDVAVPRGRLLSRDRDRRMRRSLRSLCREAAPRGSSLPDRRYLVRSSRLGDRDRRFGSRSLGSFFATLGSHAGFVRLSGSSVMGAFSTTVAALPFDEKLFFAASLETGAFGAATLRGIIIKFGALGASSPVTPAAARDAVAASSASLAFFTALSYSDSKNMAASQLHVGPLASDRRLVTDDLRPASTRSSYYALHCILLQYWTIPA